MVEWTTHVVRASLQEGRRTSCLKETVGTIHKTSNLATDHLNNYRPTSNISVLGMLIKKVVGDQLQASLEETHSLD